MTVTPMQRHRSSAAPLAWLYVGLIVYASLYPFTAWQIPGNSPLAFLVSTWPQRWTWFDVVANLLGYIPLGALVFGALARSGVRLSYALALAVGAGALLSFSLEFTQNFLPQRVPSSLDLGLNALGAETGAMLAVLVHLSGGVEWWQAARDRWFIARSAGGLALLLLWPFGLLAPLSVPFGQGQVMTQVFEWGTSLVAGTWLATFMAAWFDPLSAYSSLSSGAEFGVTALGLLTPCLLAYSVLRLAWWRRLAVVAGVVLMGVFVTTLSTALNFGPQHLLAWCTPTVLAALGLALALSGVAVAVSSRAATALGLVTLVILVMLVLRAPTDPYFSQTLQAWEQGRFVRFHGAARWVAWLWPYVTIAYLFVRLCGADDENEVRVRTQSPSRIKK
jgi:VanZ family protein